MRIVEMAQKYYPDLWNVGRLDQLLLAGKITAEEYKQIAGTERKEERK